MEASQNLMTTLILPNRNNHTCISNSRNPQKPPYEVSAALAMQSGVYNLAFVLRETREGYIYDITALACNEGLSILPDDARCMQIILDAQQNPLISNIRQAIRLTPDGPSAYKYQIYGKGPFELAILARETNSVEDVSLFRLNRSGQQLGAYGAVISYGNKNSVDNRPYRIVDIENINNIVSIAAGKEGVLAYAALFTPDLLERIGTKGRKTKTIPGVTLPKTNHLQFKATSPAQPQNKSTENPISRKKSAGLKFGKVATILAIGFAVGGFIARTQGLFKSISMPVLPAIPIELSLPQLPNLWEWFGGAEAAPAGDNQSTEEVIRTCTAIATDGLSARTSSGIREDNKRPAGSGIPWGESADVISGPVNGTVKVDPLDVGVPSNQEAWVAVVYCGEYQKNPGVYGKEK